MSKSHPRRRRAFLLGVLTGISLLAGSIMAYTLWQDHLMLGGVIGFLQHMAGG